MCLLSMKEKNKMHWTAAAPSNIALIKYAGKKDSKNHPVNPSLSYTLDHLTTSVRIDKDPALNKDQWEALTGKSFFPLKLSETAVKRYLKFFKFLKDFFKIQGFYKIQSGNNFPASAGIASSASSFCALTLAVHKLALSAGAAERKNLSLSALSALSRQGSGSSCRSFFSPWALWEAEKSRPLKLPFSRFIHQLLLLSKDPKLISSSESHKRILTSPYFKDRAERAGRRLESLLSALNKKDWKACFEVTWEEFQDLHLLYETSNPPVVYRTEDTRRVLNWLKTLWTKQGDGPLATMDAGANIHLLYRTDQRELAQKIKNYFHSEFSILSSP